MNEPLITEDTDQSVSVLTAAFSGDPFMSWLFADPETHVEHLRTWWEFLVGRRGADVELWTDGELTTVASWTAPHLDDTPDTPDDDGSAAFVEMIAELVGERLPSVLDMFAKVAEAHPSEPHWYLSAVGTVPDHQGRGHGARVLRPVLDRCDEQGLAAYLESSNPRNLAFYHRLGFEVTGEIPTPDATAVLTAMWRSPR